MIGLVLVTHGRLAEELRAAMVHVVGEQRNVATVCIGPEDDIEGRRAEIQRCIANVDTGDGVILLTDMFGGTPSNLAISQMDRQGVEVIAGVNLPMLVKLAKVRSNQPLADAVDCAQAAGRKYIAAASHVLPECRAPLPRRPNGRAAKDLSG
jgi:PTS system mannose-specific IIA component